MPSSGMICHVTVVKTYPEDGILHGRHRENLSSNIYGGIISFQNGALSSLIGT
jgi:hypothetical protein